jgi:hypothetical protein
MTVDVEHLLEFLMDERSRLNKILSDRSIINKQKQYWMYIVGKRDTLKDLINALKRSVEESKRPLEPIIGFSAPLEETEEDSDA